MNNTEFKYTLEKYKSSQSLGRCPACERKTLKFYVETATGKRLADHVGRCNREVNCAYHFKAKQFFEANGWNYTPTYTPKYKPTIKPITFFPVDLFKLSLTHYDQNNFVSFLISKFGAEVTTRLVEKYFIGTSKLWVGANIFWQIDVTGNIRSGKIMDFNPVTGRRNKSEGNRISWAHTALKQAGFNLKQCFFGEHLLINKVKPIAIVESAKSSIIASVYFPELIWLSCEGLQGLSEDKFKVLKGRNVVFYPDLGGFPKWTAKAKELSHIANIKVSDLLETIATKEEKSAGLDLADYLLRFDPKEFHEIALCGVEHGAGWFNTMLNGNKGSELGLTLRVNAIESVDSQIIMHGEEIKAFSLNGENELTQKGEFEDQHFTTIDKVIKTEDWSSQIESLVNYFNGKNIPSGPIHLDSARKISNTELFVKSTIASVTKHNGKINFKSQLEDLEAFKTILQTIN